jgi:prepilin-type N-terminal cleavage/methylation domain-containing protein
MFFDQKGFTLLELVITALIISIIVAIAIPNLIRLKSRAKEAGVKSNMHTLQLAVEDFAVQSLAIYPDNAASTTPAGDTVEDLCPGGVYPENPFTSAATNVAWDADPAAAGQIGINPANSTDYVIKGFGKSILLLLRLTPGM